MPGNNNKQNCNAQKIIRVLFKRIDSERKINNKTTLASHVSCNWTSFIMKQNKLNSWATTLAQRLVLWLPTINSEKASQQRRICGN
jgi:hypothetical protein